MKKKIIFVIKCFLVMLPFIWVALYARNNLLGFTDQEAPYYIWNKNFCTTEQEKIYTTVILGDSVSNAAYMPEVLSDTTINLALGGTTPMENYYVMREYLSNNVAPNDVFISFMDFHLVTSDCYWKRCLYSHRFKVADNWEMLQMAQKYAEPSVATENRYLDFLSYELYLPSKYITSLSNASFNGRLEGNVAAYNSDDVHGGRYIGRGVGEGTFDPIEYTDYHLEPLFDYYYRELIQLCLDNEINVHIVKLPLPNTSSFSDNYVNQFNSYYEELKTKFPAITVDWLNDGYDISYFCDVHHMNDRGALNFSMEIKRLYPEAFDDGFSNEQLAAINDNIRTENRIEEIFTWANFSPYTIIVYDAKGDFEDFYYSTYCQDGLSIRKHIMNGNDATDIYVLGSSDFAIGFDQIYQGENNLEIYPVGTAETEARYDWYPYDTNGIAVVIIDNYSGCVVTEKKFDYSAYEYFYLRQ